MSRYCGVISSPETLETAYNVGEDVTNTRGDFKAVLDWLNSKFVNTLVYRNIKAAAEEGGHLNVEDFKSGIRFAFQAFDPIRNTRSPEAEEMVLLYYTGHGLSKLDASYLNRANPNGMSSSPRLEEVNYHEANSAAQEFLTPNRVVRGGELCLHELGYCDLDSLLQPWIAAVKKTSTNSVGDKRDKHLVIIADSCYSGKLVDDLADMKDRPGPWNDNDCTVTVQSASSSVEETFGDYFTPCFVHYNQNQKELDRLINEWNNNFEFVKNAYRGIDLPSPQLETTRSFPEDADNSPVLTLSFQGFDLRLFRDPGFFKFCYLKHSRALGPPRALNGGTVNAFLRLQQFEILNYKLKTMARNGTPLALVHVDNPGDKKHFICVHIHFNNSNTELRNISGVNLVERDRQKDSSTLFLGVDENVPRKKLNLTENVRRLVRQCKDYVDEHEPGRWGDIASWNMKQFGVNHTFRMKERSDWMDEYPEEVAPVNYVIYLLLFILIMFFYTVFLI